VTLDLGETDIKLKAVKVRKKTEANGIEERRVLGYKYSRFRNAMRLKI